MDRGKKLNRERVSPLSFFQSLLIAHWRSLLLLLIGVYLPLQIFEILALKIWQDKAGFPWDVPILWAIHSTATPQLDVFAVALTQLGYAKAAVPLVSAIALILWWQKRWRSLTYLLITSFGSLLINHAAKTLIHRVRPDLWPSSAPELSFAFPSNHAMTSMTLAVIFVVLTWRSPWRWLVVVFGSLFVLGISWSRLYLGVHFPSDILAGWMVSLAWSIGVSLIIKPYLTTATPIKNSDGAADETSLLPEETQLVGKD